MGDHIRVVCFVRVAAGAGVDRVALCGAGRSGHVGNIVVAGRFLVNRVAVAAVLTCVFPVAVLGAGCVLAVDQFVLVCALFADRLVTDIADVVLVLVDVPGCERNVITIHHFAIVADMEIVAVFGTGRSNRADRIAVAVGRNIVADIACAASAGVGRVALFRAGRGGHDGGIVVRDLVNLAAGRNDALAIVTVGVARVAGSGTGRCLGVDGHGVEVAGSSDGAAGGNGAVTIVTVDVARVAGSGTGRCLGVDGHGVEVAGSSDGAAGGNGAVTIVTVDVARVAGSGTGRCLGVDGHGVEVAGSGQIVGFVAVAAGAGIGRVTLLGAGRSGHAGRVVVLVCDGAEQLQLQADVLDAQIILRGDTGGAEFAVTEDVGLAEHIVAVRALIEAAEGGCRAGDGKLLKHLARSDQRQVVNLFQCGNGGQIDACVDTDRACHCVEINARAQCLECGEQLGDARIVDDRLECVHIIRSQCSRNGGSLAAVAIGQDDAQRLRIVGVDAHIRGEVGRCIAVDTDDAVGIGGLLDIDVHVGFVVDDLRQLLGQIHHVCGAVALNLDAEAEVLLQRVVGQNAQRQVILARALHGNLPRCDRHVVIGKGGAVLQCLIEALEVEQVGDDVVGNAGCSDHIHGTDHHVGDIVLLRLALQQSQQVVELDIINGVAVDFQAGGRGVVECQIERHIQCHRLDVGDIAADALALVDIGVDDEADIAVGVALDVVHGVADGLAVHVIAVSEVGGYVGIVVTGDHGDAAADTVDRARAVGIHGGVQNEHIAGGMDVAADIVAVEVEHGRAGNGQVADDIVQQDDDGIAGQIRQLVVQLRPASGTDAVELIGGTGGVHVENQRAIAVVHIVQRCTGGDLDRRAGFVLDDHCLVGVEGAARAHERQQLIDRFRAREAELQVQAVGRRLVGQAVGEHLVVVVVLFDRKFFPEHGQGVFQRDHIGIRADHGIEIVAHEHEGDLLVDRVDIGQIHVTRRDQSRQICTVNLIGQVQGDLLHAAVGAELHVAAHFAHGGQQGRHLLGHAADVDLELQVVIQIGGAVAELEAGAQELAVAVASERDERVAGEVVIVEDGIDQRLDGDLQAAVLKVNQSLSVEAIVLIAAVHDERLHEIHHIVEADVHGQIFAAERDIGIAQCRFQGGDQSIELGLLVGLGLIVGRSGDGVRAGNAAQFLRGQANVLRFLSDGDHTVKDLILVCPACIGMCGQVDNGVVDVDGSRYAAFNDHGVLLRGIRNVHGVELAVERDGCQRLNVGQAVGIVETITRAQNFLRLCVDFVQQFLHFRSTQAFATRVLGGGKGVDRSVDIQLHLHGDDTVVQRGQGARHQVGRAGRAIADIAGFLQAFEQDAQVRAVEVDHCIGLGERALHFPHRCRKGIDLVDVLGLAHAFEQDLQGSDLIRFVGQRVEQFDHRIDFGDEGIGILVEVDQALGLVAFEHGVQLELIARHMACKHRVDRGFEDFFQLRVTVGIAVERGGSDRAVQAAEHGAVELTHFGGFAGKFVQRFGDGAGLRFQRGRLVQDLLHLCGGVVVQNQLVDHLNGVFRPRDGVRTAKQVFVAVIAVAVGNPIQSGIGRRVLRLGDQVAVFQSDEALGIGGIGLTHGNEHVIVERAGF